MFLKNNLSINFILKLWNINNFMFFFLEFFQQLIILLILQKELDIDKIEKKNKLIYIRKIAI